MKSYSISILKPCSPLTLSLIYILLSLSFVQSSWAENKIYGSLRYDYQNSDDTRPYLDNNGLSSSGKSGYHSSEKHVNQKNKRSNIGESGSRIGIEGHHDIGEGNAIIYNLEWGF